MPVSSASSRRPLRAVPLYAALRGDQDTRSFDKALQLKRLAEIQAEVGDRPGAQRIVEWVGRHVPALLRAVPAWRQGYEYQELAGGVIAAGGYRRAAPLLAAARWGTSDACNPIEPNRTG